MRYLLIIIALSFIVGCAPRLKSDCDKEYVVEQWNTTVASYEECKDHFNCEIDMHDVYVYKRTLNRIEQCENRVVE